LPEATLFEQVVSGENGSHFLSNLWLLQLDQTCECGGEVLAWDRMQTVSEPQQDLVVSPLLIECAVGREADEYVEHAAQILHRQALLINHVVQLGHKRLVDLGCHRAVENVGDLGIDLEESNQI